jgi:hypothetical protein
LLEDLGNIFTGSAKKTFGTFNCKNIDSKINKNKNGQNQKPWFDQDCKFSRQINGKSKRRYKLNNTVWNSSIMIDDQKGYKKVMNESNFSSSMFSWKSVTFSFSRDFILAFGWLVFLTVLLLLSLLFKITDNTICSGAWTSENNLLLSPES